MSSAHQPAGDEPTAILLDRACSESDADREAARALLVERFLPRLQRWARGRLPQGARSRAETDDLVQVTLMRALRRVDSFENRGDGAFLAYLRQILLNAVRDEIRHVSRRPHHNPLPQEEHLQPADDSPSAVEQAIGREAIERYEAALVELEPRQREAVLLRVEFGYDYADIAEAVAAPSANAARMVVSRALVRVAECMEP